MYVESSQTQICQGVRVFQTAAEIDFKEAQQAGWVWHSKGLCFVFVFLNLKQPPTLQTISGFIHRRMDGLLR